jgi:hypothetical protein
VRLPNTRLYWPDWCLRSAICSGASARRNRRDLDPAGGVYRDQAVPQRRTQGARIRGQTRRRCWPITAQRGAPRLDLPERELSQRDPAQVRVMYTRAGDRYPRSCEGHCEARMASQYPSHPDTVTT